MKQHQPSPAPKAPREEGAGRGHRLQPGPDPSPVGARSPPRTGAAPRCRPAARAAPRARANIFCQGTAQEGLVSWHRGWMKMGRGRSGMAAPCCRQEQDKAQRLPRAAQGCSPQTQSEGLAAAAGQAPRRWVGSSPPPAPRAPAEQPAAGRAPRGQVLPAGWEGWVGAPQLGCTARTEPQPERNKAPGDGAAELLLQALPARCLRSQGCGVWSTASSAKAGRRLRLAASITDSSGDISAAPSTTTCWGLPPFPRNVPDRLRASQSSRVPHIPTASAHLQRKPPWGSAASHGSSSH